MMKSHNAAAARATVKAYAYNSSVPISTDNGAAVTSVTLVVSENRATPYAFTSSNNTSNNDMTWIKVESNPMLPLSAAFRVLAC
jgi:hypothetical protein